MNDPLALDVAALERDRARYLALLEQAEAQITAWNERADHLMTAIDGLDRLLAFAPVDVGVDGGRPRKAAPVRPAPAVVAPPEAATTKAPATRKGAPVKKAAAPVAAAAPPAKRAPDPAAPKGADAIKAILAAEPARAFSLQDLLDGLGAKGWLGESKRPEEGVRIALKRLTDRGGADRTADGLWRHVDPATPRPAAPVAEADAATTAVAPEPTATAPVPGGPTEPKPKIPVPTEPSPPPPAPAGAFGLWRSGG